MDDQEIALEASTGTFKSLVDGTLRLIIDFEPRNKNDAVKYFGSIGTHIVVAPLTKQANITNDITQTVSTKGPYGNYAQILDKNGFWMHDAVHDLAGSDADYQAWCRTQPCTMHYGHCAPECWNENKGCFDIVYAHMNFSCNSGKGIKNKTKDGMPLCNTAHMLIQHQDGDIELAIALGIPYGQRPTKAQTQEFLLTKCRKLRAIWSRKVIKKDVFNKDSWADVNPDSFKDWTEDESIKHLVPRGYIYFDFNEKVDIKTIRD